MSLLWGPPALNGWSKVPRTCRAGMDCLDLREVSNLPIDGNEMMAVGDEAHDQRIKNLAPNFPHSATAPASDFGKLDFRTWVSWTHGSFTSAVPRTRL
ncbi:hypothetical protein ACCO45_003586 [Purpureocillium lilacinum]|uniref:Uncharacterized protein n=1 Tax=Purpureocillium lilacinum TaxID=33203 RepID=A0ACC4E3G7_PURLI